MIPKINTDFQEYLDWMYNTPQEAKQTEGKPKLSLVPFQINYAIEQVRQFGITKYKDPDSWREYPIQDHYEALYRHVGRIWSGDIIDSESGLPHTWHIACRVAFIIELEKGSE